MDNHRLYRLGKGPAKLDKRTLELGHVLDTVKIPTVPLQYDVDLGLKLAIPGQMFCNDELGCCVIAGRANQTLRFERYERGDIIPIRDSDVRREYFKESGGKDTGLVVIDSLNRWRRGWKTAGNIYQIHAYAKVRFEQLRAAIYLFQGAGLGLNLPLSAQTQIDSGLGWTITNERHEEGTWGGHYVWACGYTPDGIVCVTWGKKQFMSNGFVQQYCDEAYAIIDEEDKGVHGAGKNPLNIDKLSTYLESLEE